MGTCWYERTFVNILIESPSFDDKGDYTGSNELDEDYYIGCGKGLWGTVI